MASATAQLLVFRGPETRFPNRRKKVKIFSKSLVLRIARMKATPKATATSSRYASDFVPNTGDIKWRFYGFASSILRSAPAWVFDIRIPYLPIGRSHLLCVDCQSFCSLFHCFFHHTSIEISSLSFSSFFY